MIQKSQNSNINVVVGIASNSAVSGDFKNKMSDLIRTGEVADPELIRHVQPAIVEPLFSETHLIRRNSSSIPKNMDNEAGKGVSTPLEQVGMVKEENEY